MTRQSTASRPVFSASKVLEAVSSELTTIKNEDGLTDADIGRVLGKSEDMAAKYRTGLAEMGVVAYAAAKREWNGRFTGALDRLCVDSRPKASTDHDSQARVLRAALAMCEAIRDDGMIDLEEVRANRVVFEHAAEAIIEQLAKLRDEPILRGVS